MSNFTKITLIIPCYNQEQYLDRCLQSDLHQTFQDFEILIINDGSTDNSLKIIENYQQQDKRIKLIIQENRGQSSARNSALALANSKYVCFLDTDDFLNDDFLEKLYNKAEETDADVVMSQTLYHTGSSQSLTHIPPQTLFNFSDKLKILPHGACWDKIYKTQFLRKYHIYFPVGLYWEDNFFVLQVCYFSRKFVVIDDTYYNYISNPHSTTHDITKITKCNQDGISVASMIMNFMKENKCSPEDRKIVTDMCLRFFINRKNLINKAYTQKLSVILENTTYFRKLKRKAFWRRLKQKCGIFLKK